MARSRALITFEERRRISGEADVSDQKRYEAISRVRRRITEELPEEIAMLADAHPGLLQELLETVEHERNLHMREYGRDAPPEPRPEPQMASADRPEKPDETDE